MPLPDKLIKKIANHFGYSTEHPVEIPGYWEPEDSKCFGNQDDLLLFYDAIANVPGFHLLDPTEHNYNRMYVGLGVNSTEVNLADHGYVLRNRGHYNRINNNRGQWSDTKVCLKSSGKENTRREYELDVRSFRAHYNMRALGKEFPEIPREVISIPPDSLNVSSVAGVSRTGYHGFHLIPELDSIAFYALSNDVCQPTTPSIFTNVKRTDVVLLPKRFEGEYESYIAFTNNESLRNPEGAELIYMTSLQGIAASLENAGLPVVQNDMNKIEAADAEVARFYEENHASANGYQTALSIGLKAKDYQRSYMRDGLDIVCRQLPTQGTVLPANFREKIWLPKELVVA